MDAGHYKIHADGTWTYAAEDKVVINKSYFLCWETHQDASYPIDGWSWHDTAPQEYLDWLESLELINEGEGQ